MEVVVESVFSLLYASYVSILIQGFNAVPLALILVLQFDSIGKVDF